MAILLTDRDSLYANVSDIMKSVDECGHVVGQRFLECGNRRDIAHHVFGGLTGVDVLKSTDSEIETGFIVFQRRVHVDLVKLVASLLISVSEIILFS